ncbi:SLAC1 anion channel family protein [Pseudomonas sp. BN102]|uniref:SLAC1 anion channel family protein n=1 Tax=Pseudomonas sp. BN102 TaxID=2567886 RepID=UPI002456C483|nr:SLAC1 anion channel family protein [Pseudomonas sp. BN102]MDH4612186.1 C4-dicarboxylate ABC transporter [Pseudomonas sp. BN102]
MNTVFVPPLEQAQAKPVSSTSIKNLPVNLFGTVMGLAGLGLAWRLAHQHFGVSALIGEAIGLFAALVFVVLGLGYLTKLARHRQAVLNEFNHPIAGNFFGTIVIAILLLSVVAAPYSEQLGQALWTVGSLLTVVLGGLVLSRLFQGKQDLQHAVPAWLIPGVATLDIAVTGAHMPMAWAHELNLFAMAVGAAMALIFFTSIFPRLVHQEPLAKGMVPSLMILVAPFEVGFLAYTNLFGIDRFAAMLFYFGLFLAVVLGFKVFRRDVPFAPSWWAISFPLAALANAALKYAQAQGGLPLQLIAWVILVFLTLSLAVLTWKTLVSLVRGKLLAG